MFHENPTITFKRLWPAIKLINNRTPKLIGFAIKEINSIGTKSNAKKKPVFGGKNKENNSKIENEVQKEIIKLCSSFPIYKS